MHFARLGYPPEQYRQAMGLVSKLFKVDSGWFAARPSGTESISKLYAESLKNGDHLTAIVEQVQEIVRRSSGRK